MNFFTRAFKHFSRSLPFRLYSSQIIARSRYISVRLFPSAFHVALAKYILPTFPSIPLDPRNQFPTYETQILASARGGGFHRGSLCWEGKKGKKKKKEKSAFFFLPLPPSREGEAIGFAAKEGSRVGGG